MRPGLLGFSEKAQPILTGKKITAGLAVRGYCQDRKNERNRSRMHSWVYLQRWSPFRGQSTLAGLTALAFVSFPLEKKRYIYGQMFHQSVLKSRTHCDARMHTAS